MNDLKKEKEKNPRRMESRVRIGGGGVGINWEIGIDIYTLLYIKQITNNSLRYRTGNYTQYFVINYNGK